MVVQASLAKHSSLQLLTAFNLCHCEKSNSTAAFVVAAKPNQHKQKLVPDLSQMRTCQVVEIRQLVGELITKPQHSRGRRHTTSQSQLHRQHLATAVADLHGSQGQKSYNLQMRYNGCGAETITQLSTANWNSVDFSRSPIDAAGIFSFSQGLMGQSYRSVLDWEAAGQYGRDTAHPRWSWSHHALSTPAVIMQPGEPIP